MAISPKKSTEHASKAAVHVGVVGKHRLGEGTHSTVFPSHVGESHWHNGPRQPHHGSHSVTPKGKK
jgi:hypothetical protein